MTVALLGNIIRRAAGARTAEAKAGEASSTVVMTERKPSRTAADVGSDGECAGEPMREFVLLHLWFDDGTQCLLTATQLLELPADYFRHIVHSKFVRFESAEART